MSATSKSAEIRQLVSSLKSRCKRLEEENDLLQQENDLLRKRLDRARGKPQTTEESDDQRFDTWDGVNQHTEKLREAATKAGIRTSEGEWRAPNLDSHSELEDDASSSSGRMRSRSMGAPLNPNQFNSAEPSTSRKDAPPIDMGYVNKVGAEQLDELPYGMIILDRDGQVLFYNETEARQAGFRPEEVVGENFFTDVAPCTRVKEFEGRFKKFVDGELGRVTFFDFAFHFEAGTQDVTIALSQGRKKGQVNVMLMRR
jgi:photoactive yellow protein